MKVEVHGYEHVENGISIQLIPETQAEVTLIKVAWKHGKMKKDSCSSSLSAFTTEAFCIGVFAEKKEKTT